MSPARRNLILLAALGYFALLLQQEFFVGGARPSTEYVYAFLAVLLGVGLLVGPARAGFRVLRATPDLLVPFGCYELLKLLLGWLPVTPMHLNLADPFAQFVLLGFLVLLASFALHVVFLLWMTRLLADVVTGRGCDLWGALLGIRPWLWRGVAVVFCAWALLYLPLVLAMWTGATHVGGLEFVLILVGGWGVAINFGSVLWLPLALRTDREFGEAMADATRRCRDLVRESWDLLVGWLVAVGYVAWYSFDVSSFQRSQSNASWEVGLEWLGGFPDDTKWYSGLCSQAGVVAEGLLGFPIMVLFVAVTIAMKLTLLARAMRVELQPPR